MRLKHSVISVTGNYTCEALLWRWRYTSILPVAVFWTDIHEQDIVGWETMDITDPQSLKGIVGEFAATIGPKVVKHSAVALFPEED